MQNITPHLWFDKQAREAAELYVSLIPGSKLKKVTTLTGTPSGDCDLVSFELSGQPFMAISAGPLFKFNPSVSFHLKCGTREEVDKIWGALSDGGNILMPLDKYPFSERYGWLQDKYGLSWQVMYTPGGSGDRRITPALMFVGNVCGKAEEALEFYVSVFRGAPGETGNKQNRAEILARHGNSAPEKEGTVQYARAWLLGQEFAAMDSAREHNFAFNEAISFLAPCDTQEEIDYLWEKLSADPKAEQCGWLKDKYGLSWQIAPVMMQQLLGSGDKARLGRVTQAFLKMKKFDIAALERAAG
ncbi:MAG: VOC family protein [Bryobacterales bacterium]|nr:VOC family protein [Bryobacterales bacterium]MBV9401992.1 VOC family protein [Bryobacterales bacterium]